MIKKNLEIEDAVILFRNFTGVGTQYNRLGDKNFSVRLDEESALPLIEDGWNIKPLKPLDESDPEVYYHLPVKVRFDIVPPTIWLITNGSRSKKTLLNEKTVSVLDFADIVSADLVIKPYNWNAQGKSGIKAYLKTAYITIEEDRFAAKYAEEEYPQDDVPFEN